MKKVLALFVCSMLLTLSIVGCKGKKGEQGEKGIVESLIGPKGPFGPAGPPGCDTGKSRTTPTGECK